MAATKFLIPQEGLLIRDPSSKNPLAEAGEEKPWIGKDGRYWRRRVRDKSCIIRLEKIKKKRGNS